MFYRESFEHRRWEVTGECVAINSDIELFLCSHHGADELCVLIGQKVGSLFSSSFGGLYCFLLLGARSERSWISEFRESLLSDYRMEGVSSVRGRA